MIQIWMIATSNKWTGSIYLTGDMNKLARI